MQTDDLDQLLAEAARTRPDPSPELIDRVLLEAYAHQPQPKAATARRAAVAERPRLLSRLAGAFGGGPLLAGVCTAALAGVALGYLDPTTYDFLTAGLADVAVDSVDLFPTSDFLSEG